MANSAFDHSPTITVPGSSTNTALVRWNGTGGKTFLDSTILVGATTMGLAADTDLLTFGNGTIAITGAVTGVTALTASGAVTGGTLVGTVTTATQNSITTMTGLTTVGTVGTGVWNGTAIVQAYIGAEAINESKLQISNGPTNGQVLTARSGNTGGMTWEAAGGGGLDSDADAIIHNNYGFVLGHTAQLPAGDNPGNVVAEFQMAGTSDADTAIHIIRHSADAATASIKFGKSRNATIGSHTIVADNDVVGSISWHGCDGGDFIPRIAEMRGVVDGTPGTNDMPGRLEFYTTADGAQDPTLAMTINNQGAITTPLQPCFSIQNDSTDSNIGTSAHTVGWNTENFDQGGDFASNTFTAPVAGKYLFAVMLQFVGITASVTNISVRLVTNNLNFQQDSEGREFTESEYYNTSGVYIAEMAAGHTAHVQVTVTGLGTVDINGGQFSGCLIA